MNKLQDLGVMLGLAASGITMQLETTPEKAQQIAEDIIGTISDYRVAQENIENAKKSKQSKVTIKGYTFTLPA